MYFTYRCMTVSGCFTSLHPISSLQSGNEMISASEWYMRAEAGVSVHWSPAQAERVREGYEMEGKSS